MKSLVAATAVSLMLTGSAFAQTQPAPTPAQTTTGQTQFYRATTDDQRASKVIGTTVKNSAGESIGEINELVVGKDGKVAAAIVGVGGFLGLGQREIAVPFGALQMTMDSNSNLAVVLPNATKDSLKAAPEWKWATKS